MSTKKPPTKSETAAESQQAPRKAAEPDPSVFPASAPYEPGARAFRGKVQSAAPSQEAADGDTSPT